MVGVGTLLGTQGLAASMTMAAATTAAKVAISTINTVAGPDYSATTRGFVALVFSGQMWRGAQGTTQVDPLFERVRALERNVMIAASSVGSLTALVGGMASDREQLPSNERSAQATTDASHVGPLWRSFAEKTWMWQSIKQLVTFIPKKIANGIRSLFGGKKEDVRPFAFRDARDAALKAMDEQFARQGLAETGRLGGFKRVFDSDVTIVLAAAEKDRTGPSCHPVYLVKEGADTGVTQKIERAIEGAHQIFDGQPGSLRRPQVIKLESETELATAARASTQVPVFFTPLFKPFEGIMLGARRLFDGAWGDNAPVLAALAAGATEVFVFNDSPNGVVRQTEVQAQLVKPLRNAVRLLARTGIRRFAAWRDQVEQLYKPVDLVRVLEQFPNARIHVVGLPKDYPEDRVDPTLGRFLLPSLDLVDTILASGTGQIDEIMGLLRTNGAG